MRQLSPHEMYIKLISSEIERSSPCRTGRPRWVNGYNSLDFIWWVNRPRFDSRYTVVYYTKTFTVGLCCCLIIIMHLGTALKKGGGGFDNQVQ